MSTVFKTAVQYAKVNGKMDIIHAVTGLGEVGETFNEDGTVNRSLGDVLTEFTAALAEKAKSTDVTQEIQTACSDLYNKLLGRANNDVTINEAYDTLKEIADWITDHGEAAATLFNDVTALKTSVEELTQQIEDAGVTVEASETNGNIKVNGEEVKVYENQGTNVFTATTAEGQASAEAKMKNGDILFFVVPTTVELKDAPDEVKAANHYIGNPADICTHRLKDLPETAYTFAAVYYKTDGNIETNDILYIDSATVYNATYGTANLATGKFDDGTTVLHTGDLYLPAGYYKVKRWYTTSSINNHESRCMEIVFGTFDSSGAVSALTPENVNSYNKHLEYIGETFEVSAS